MSRLLFTVFIYMVPLWLYGQTPYNHQANYLKANDVWAFGVNAGVDFSQGAGVPIHTAMNAEEGCASVASATTGQLLFYASDNQCFNRNNQVMPNGDNLLGANSTTTQAFVIVPFIDSPGKYYLFALNYQGNIPGLYYSVVDTSLDNGLGDVVPGRKNILITADALSEAMIAVPGNDCDIWLLVHEHTAPVFRAYHITRNGLDTTPVLSTAGQAQGTNSFYLASLAVSPDRKLISLTGVSSPFLGTPSQTGLWLFDLDAGTGMVSNSASIDATNSYYYSCFSPNNSKLYAAMGTAIVQFDLSNNNAKTFIGNAGGNWATAIKSYHDTLYTLYNSGVALARINKPDMAGTAATFQPNVIHMLGGTHGVYGLPNDVVYPLPPDTMHTVQLHALLCTGNDTHIQVTLHATPGYAAYVWNDGATDSVRTITQPGTYWALGKDECHSHIDSFFINQVAMEFSLGNDTTICSAPPYRLAVTIPDAGYIWNDGSTNTTYDAPGDGTYSVTVNKEGCSASDTINVSFFDTRANLGNDTVVCNNEAIHITLSTTIPDGAQALWSTGSKEATILAQQTGAYWVTISKQQCTTKDTINISSQLCSCTVNMPDAFTPNGDGRNDIFRPIITHGCVVSGYTMQVYNRWGQLVYSTQANALPAEGWDGTMNGQPAELGAYMYTISLQAGVHSEHYSQKGTVILIK